jgi:hypothetical protein
VAIPSLATLPAALVFAAIFLFGSALRLQRPRWHLAAVSAAAGASCAYVFVELMPELSEAGQAFVEATGHLKLPFPEYRVYLAALVGFVFFYGLEHMTSWSERTGRKGAPEYGSGDPIYLLHIGGFAAYAWLVTYTLVRGPERTSTFVVLYAVAMGLHFLSLERSLVEEHEELYHRPGRQILAGAVLAGWACGVLFGLSRPVILTATGFIAGSVVMNNLIAELPGDRNGRYWPFALGAAGYALLTLIMNRTAAG